jgi:hypothetical protein
VAGYRRPDPPQAGSSEPAKQHRERSERKRAAKHELLVPVAQSVLLRQQAAEAHKNKKTLYLTLTLWFQ